MGFNSYASNSATVGKISDNNTQKPSGTGSLQITPTIPGAVAQTSKTTGAVYPFYTRTSSSVLVVTFAASYVIGFTTGSKIAVFWTDTSGVEHFCPDCTITSVTGQVVTITAPLSTLSALQLAAGALYFNGATTTGASDVAGIAITAGTTTITVSVATIATADTPANPDLTDWSIPIANVSNQTGLMQLLLTCSQGGLFELFQGGTLALLYHYSTAGDFYNWVNTVGSTAPYATNPITKMRFYNNSVASNVMSVGANLN
jgi:hypothetical protein